MKRRDLLQKLAGLSAAVPIAALAEAIPKPVDIQQATIVQQALMQDPLLTPAAKEITLKKYALAIRVPDADIFMDLEESIKEAQAELYEKMAGLIY